MSKRDREEEDIEEELRALKKLETAALAQVAASKKAIREKEKELRALEAAKTEEGVIDAFMSKMASMKQDVAVFIGRPVDWMPDCSDTDDERFNRMKKFRTKVNVEATAKVASLSGHGDRRVVVRHLEEVTSVKFLEVLGKELSPHRTRLLREVAEVLDRKGAGHLLSQKRHPRVERLVVASDTEFDSPGEPVEVSATLIVHLFVSKKLLRSTTLVNQFTLETTMSASRDPEFIREVCILSANTAFVLTGDRMSGFAMLIDFVLGRVIWKRRLPVPWVCGGDTHNVAVTAFAVDSVIRVDSDGGPLVLVNVSTSAMTETVLWPERRFLSRVCVLPDGWITALQWQDKPSQITPTPRLVSKKILLPLPPRPSAKDATRSVLIPEPVFRTDLTAFGEGIVFFTRKDLEVVSVNPLAPVPTPTPLGTEEGNLRSSIWSPHLLSRDSHFLLELDPSTGDVVSKIPYEPGSGVSNPFREFCISWSKNTLFVHDVTKATKV